MKMAYSREEIIGSLLVLEKSRLKLERRIYGNFKSPMVFYLYISLLSLLIKVVLFGYDAGERVSLLV